MQLSKELINIVYKRDFFVVFAQHMVSKRFVASLSTFEAGMYFLAHVSFNVDHSGNAFSWFVTEEAAWMWTATRMPFYSSCVFGVALHESED